MRRVVFNQKGGVGKTTIVANLAAIAAERGGKVLVIDLDSQCNATQYLLGDAVADSNGTIADYFESTLAFGKLGNKGLDPFITPTAYNGLYLVAGSPDLEHLQPKLEARQKIYKLRQALDKLGEFDSIFIDTPPALNFYSRSALIASERVLVPFDCDDFARQALYVLLDNIAEIQADHNEDLVLDGIVVNQFQARAKLPNKLVEELIAEGQPVLGAKLSPSIKVKESHDASVPLVHFDAKHKISQQFSALYDEING